MAGNLASDWPASPLPALSAWGKQRRRIFTTGRSALRYVYARVRHTVCALSPHATLPALGHLEIQRLKHFTANAALRKVMEESHPWDEGEISRRQQLGDACYLVFMGDRCVHYSWMTQQYRKITEIGFDATLKDNDVWIYDCYTTPEYRGQSIYPQVLTRILEDARDRDSELVWIDVEASNDSSIRGMLKAGFLAVAHLEKRTLFSRFVLSRKKKLMSLSLGELFEEMPSRFQ